MLYGDFVCYICMIFFFEKKHSKAARAPTQLAWFFLNFLLEKNLIGGVARTDAAGSRTRGESHCLIIGDPGTDTQTFSVFGTHTVSTVPERTRSQSFRYMVHILGH